MARSFRRGTRRECRALARAFSPREDGPCRNRRPRSRGCARHASSLRSGSSARGRGALPFPRALGLSAADRLRRGGRIAFGTTSRSCSGLANIRASRAAACLWCCISCRRRIGRSRSRPIFQASGAALGGRSARKCVGAIPSTPGLRIRSRQRRRSAPNAASSE